MALTSVGVPARAAGPSTTTTRSSAFFVTNRDGSPSFDLETTDLGPVLAQLDDVAGHEEPSVSLTHHSGWTLQAFPSGRLLLTHTETAPRRLHGATRELITGLWACLADGDLDTIEAQDWRTVNGHT